MIFMTWNRINNGLQGTVTRVWRGACAGLAGALLVACVGNPQLGTGTVPAGLVGSAWNLVSFTSLRNTVGDLKPAQSDQFQLEFGQDGKAAFRFDCNRGTGSWQADASSAPSGNLRFRQVATTRALCPPQPMGDRLPWDIELVRSYRLVGDRLYLTLLNEDGFYEWSRRR
jgi:heat shock protein HslJ